MVLPDATTLARDLAHVLWIGGAPDAGKTTVARLLAERRRWQWYHCDSHAESHLARSDPTQLPATYAKLDKSIEACQYVDTCLGWITKAMRTVRGVTLITADHGNAEQMIDPKTGQPHTAHTTNPVPFHLIDEDSLGVKLRAGGALEDVAPTMLGLLGIEQPSEMTGRDLRE